MQNASGNTHFRQKKYRQPPCAALSLKIKKRRKIPGLRITRKVSACLQPPTSLPPKNKVGQRTQKQDGTQHNFFENLVVCALHEIDVRSLLKHRAR